MMLEDPINVDLEAANAGKHKCWLFAPFLVASSLPAAEQGYEVDWWAQIARDFRRLAEPVVSFEYYRANRHMQEGHYAQGLDSPDDEVCRDNNRRPMLYAMLQSQESMLSDSPPSSLRQARRYQALLDCNPMPSTWSNWLALEAGQARHAAAEE